jgi:hypothetical protein
VSISNATGLMGFLPVSAQTKSRHGEPVRLFDEAEKAD